MMGQCRVGASMSEDYDNHALHCPECSAVEAARAERLDAGVRLLREMLDKRPQWDMALDAAARAFVESEGRG